MTDTLQFLYYLDNQVRHTILKPSNMKKMFNSNTDLVINLIYNSDDYLYVRYALNIVYELKKQLQDKDEARQDQTILYNRKNQAEEQLELLKAVANMMPFKDEEDEEIDEYVLFCYLQNNNWEKIIKLYKYNKAIELVEECDALHNDMLDVFIELDKERVYDVAEKIALNKIKRSKVFNYGLGLQLNMRNCGIELQVA
jgi:hypothetical protein